MMIGLPASSLEKELETAKKICELGADGARVYPTVVFADTELSNMSVSGDYEPLTEEDAVRRTAAVREVFDAIMDIHYFIEINTKAFEAHHRFFPDYSFWNLLKKYDAPILFNTDVHFPHLVESGRQQAIELYNKL